MVMLIAGKASAQFSINAAYISQQHTFNYKNGSLSDFSQEDKWLKGGMLGVSLSTECSQLQVGFLFGHVFFHILVALRNRGLPNWSWRIEMS